ncbi:uncharacterized protein LOC125488556 isoform X1 [Plutella xylostella]|uniref:uncharacterized protein LOC125488556 isoform X1 n=2 Tax=Plutella xylostella TaxID=51655 RepID=UPI0020323E9E|nr:uncharacterized protein LOC125488556 isoform X1 [Plutella xylostella]
MGQYGNILLPTIKVGLVDKLGNTVYAKALCDSGSQISFISSDLADQISCELKDEQTIISGICQGKNKTAKKAKFTIYSENNDYSLKLTCCIVSKITCDLPQFDVDIGSLNIPTHIKLADRDFNKSEPISILLGCDIFFKILLREQLPIIPGGLYLHDTRFGYVVAGQLPLQRSPATTSQQITAVSNFCNLDNEISSREVDDTLTSIDSSLKQLWRCEQVPQIYKEASSEQELAETMFQESVQLEHCKFQVKLPLKQEFNEVRLGNSLSRALQRFYNLEKRFLKDPLLFQQYKQFIDEYVSLGHAKYVDIESYNLEEDPVYFLSHHPVINESSKTTRLRVVFDGSMQTDRNISLNDLMLNGPCVQNSLFNILILFRLHKFVLVTDIKKMFRNIKLDPSQCSIQNILWRSSPQERIKCIQLLTITYGLKSSNYLATRCLNELAHRYKDKYPLGSDMLLNNTFVDDITASSNSLEELGKIKEQLIELLALGGFQLHKLWSKQYLVQLQNRPKWQNSLPNIEVGTLVLLRSDNIPPLSWPMARVVETFPGSDGKVRALSVKTTKGTVIRTSVTKVCVLPIDK